MRLDDHSHWSRPDAPRGHPRSDEVLAWLMGRDDGSFSILSHLRKLRCCCQPWTLTQRTFFILIMKESGAFHAAIQPEAAATGSRRRRPHWPVSRPRAPGKPGSGHEASGR